MRRPPWRFIPHKTGEGSYNLALDAQLLKEKFPFPVLRFYSWASPCISYGYFQTPPPQNGLPAYRRITGGGTVFHNKDLTYSLTYPRDSALPWGIKRSYCEIHRLIRQALQTLGIETVQGTEDNRGDFCFESPVSGDLLCEGKKVVGSAQRRMGNHLLHQGTIRVEQLGVDRLFLIEAILNEFRKTYSVTFEINDEENPDR